MGVLHVLTFLSLLSEVFAAKIKSTGPVEVTTGHVDVKVASTKEHRAADVVITNLQTHKLSISEGKQEDWHPFDGIGALSAGASSRLLQDYPKEQRSEILDLLFKPRYGASLQVLKVEIGGDMQSTDGSEPSHMRFRGEKPDCSRGYEAWLLKEAKARNPQIRTYGLAWGVPGWIGNGTFYSEDNIKYQVSWLQCIKENFEVEVDYIGIWNEMHWGASWYLFELADAIKAAGLKTELVLLDAVSGVDPAFLAEFKQDEKLQKVAAAVGLHYPCEANKGLLDALKPHPSTRFWASEELSTVADWGGAGCWGRMINQNFVRMNATSSIAWSLIWSAYPNLECFGNGLLYAFQPWGGFYEVTPPVWTMAHTTQFTEVGWSYLPVGEGAGLLPEGGTYVTIVSPSLDDFTVVMETLQGTCMYHQGCYHEKQAVLTQRISLKLSSRLEAAAQKGDLEVWATNASHQFLRLANAVFEKDGLIHLLVPVDSIITISTLKGATKQGDAAVSDTNATKELPKIPKPTFFSLPFNQSFDDVAVGSSPPFFADQGGAFEVVEAEGTLLSRSKKGNKVLEQKVLQPPIAWAGFSPNPFTLFGGTNWTDVFASVAVRLDNQEDIISRILRPSPLVEFGKQSSLLSMAEKKVRHGEESPRQAGLCVRVTRYQFFGSRTSKPDGYCLEVNVDPILNIAYWRLTLADLVLAAGHIGGIGLTKVIDGGWFQLGLQAREARIIAHVNDEKVADLIDTTLPIGQVALGCSYHKCQFDDLHVEHRPPACDACSVPMAPDKGEARPVLGRVLNVHFDYNARSCNPPPELTKKRSDFTGLIGFAFSVLYPAHLQALGRLMIRGGNEMATSHTVELLEMGLDGGPEPTIIIASVALPTSPNGQAGVRMFEDGFIYAELQFQPILHPGKTYVLASTEMAGGDVFYDRAMGAYGNCHINLTGPAYKPVGGIWTVDVTAPSTTFGPLNALILPLPLPPSEQACFSPTSLGEGYDINEIDLRFGHFHVEASCRKPYVGTAVVSPCKKPLDIYSISGCEPPLSKQICFSPTDGHEGYEITEVHLHRANFHVVVSCAKGYTGVPQASSCNRNGGEYKLSGCHPEAAPDPEDHPDVKVNYSTNVTRVTTRTVVPNKTEWDGKVEVEIHKKDHPDVKVNYSHTNVTRVTTRTVVPNKTGKVEIKVEKKDYTVIHTPTNVTRVTTRTVEPNKTSKVVIEVHKKDHSDAAVIKSGSDVTHVDTRTVDSDKTNWEGKIEIEIKKKHDVPPVQQNTSSVKVDVSTKHVEASLAKAKEAAKEEKAEKKEEQKVEDKDKEMEEVKKNENKEIMAELNDNIKLEKAEHKDEKAEESAEQEEAKAEPTPEITMTQDGNFHVKVQFGENEVKAEQSEADVDVGVLGTKTTDATVSEVVDERA